MSVTSTLLQMQYILGHTVHVVCMCVCWGSYAWRIKMVGSADKHRLFPGGGGNIFPSPWRKRERECVSVCVRRMKKRDRREKNSPLISIDYFWGVGETFSLPPGERECVSVCVRWMKKRDRREKEKKSPLISIDYFRGVGEIFSLPPGESERKRVCLCMCGE